MPTRIYVHHLLVVLGAALLLATTIAGSAAQEATSTATVSPDEPERELAYPVSIHRGTCDNPVAQLVGPSIDSGIAGFDSDAELVGVTSQQPAMIAEADFDGTIDHFADTPHVVAVHASADEFGTIIACGEIAGYVDGDQLVIPLRGVGDSSVSGVAVIRENTTLVEEALELIDESLRFGDASVNLTVYTVPAEDPATDRSDPGRD